MIAVRAFLAEEEGPTAVEYAVMLAFIIIVCVVAIQSVGTVTNSNFSKVTTGFDSPTTGS
jgi:pilus assembly protein Flp/PilA